jgi:hypothetical protein
MDAGVKLCGVCAWYLDVGANPYRGWRKLLHL